MSIWPFNRKNKQQQSAVANEIQDYYQSERRERKGVAWLLAIATFFVTLLAVLVLFYGGKWAYNKIRGDEPTSTEVVQEQEPEQTGQNDQNDQPQEPAQSKPSSDDRQVSGQSDAPQTSSTNTTTPSPSTPVTGPASEELPRTGPDQDL